jgi:hypothetical protein
MQDSSEPLLILLKRITEDQENIVLLPVGPLPVQPFFTISLEEGEVSALREGRRERRGSL